MADVADVQVLENGFRNVVLKVALVSDGSGVALQKIYDATSGGTYGVNIAGATLYPGIHSKVVGLDFDVQDMKFALYWEATANVLLMAMGASPTSFNWRKQGGLFVPVVAGATGSILLSTIDPMPNATLTAILYLRKDVKQ